MRTYVRTCDRLCAHPPLRARGGPVGPRGDAGEAGGAGARAGRAAGGRGRSRARPRRSGSTRGCASARRSARCPGLGLVPPDRERAAEAWERALGGWRRSAPRSSPSAPARPSSRSRACGRCGASAEQVLGRARRQLGRAGAAGRGPDPALRPRGRARGAPAAAGPVIVAAPGRRAPFLASPARWAAARAPGRRVGPGERCPTRSSGWGCARSASWRALPAAAVADRFGEPGLRALRMAERFRGAAAPRARPRAAGRAARAARGLLGPAARARPGAADRPAARRARLGAGGRCGGCGSARAWPEAAAGAPRWRCARRAPIGERLRLALAPKLGELPGPASALALRALELGPPARDQPALEPSPRERRRERIAEAVRQARAAAGRDAVLRVLEVEPDSRVPERRAIFTPVSRTARSSRRATQGRCERVVYWPTPVEVEAGEDGVPLAVGRGRGRGGARGLAGRGPLVDAEAAERRYFELALADGRCVVVFREPAGDGRWFEQRGVTPTSSCTAHSAFSFRRRGVASRTSWRWPPRSRATRRSR